MKVLALALISVVSTTAVAQHPNVDRNVDIGAGESVHLLSRFVNDRGPAMVSRGKRLDFVYTTKIPASDAAARQAQADRAAQVFGAQAVELGMNRLSIGICDTDACAQGKHPPSNWYLYERTHSGWKRVP